MIYGFSSQSSANTMNRGEATVRYLRGRVAPTTQRQPLVSRLVARDFWQSRSPAKL